MVCILINKFIVCVLQSFCVSVYLVTQLNSDILLQRLRQNGIRHPYHTQALG